MQKYQPQELKKKWNEKWKKETINKFQFLLRQAQAFGSEAAQARRDPEQGRGTNSKQQISKKFYNLVELPYTSGDLHIGHWFTFTTPDVLARYKRMSGYEVFFPIGYDAFGLPAENAAIKRSIHPKDWTMKNIENMTKQFQMMGTMINNWDDVVITCLPEYYRWNQRIFLKMYEKGLAYRGKALSNWCPSCQTVLANENIENGKCWRCGNQVILKEVEQWFLKITGYADRLLWDENSNGVDWPKQVQVGQNNWIGRKEGINIKYQISNIKYQIECFTTRPDTNFGATFIVVAPEHPFVEKILKGKISPPSVIPRSEATRNLAKEVNVKKIKDYVEQAKRKTEEQRKIEAKKKTGVFTGFYAVNDLNGKLMPIWISDFALMNVGTGALVGVPGHDERDFDFAKTFGLETIRVVVGKDGDKSPITRKEQVQEEEGTMINSGFLDGMDIHKATEVIMDYIEKKGWGKRTVKYHLRDWSVSRQRYWGTPVPIINCPKDGIVPVPYKDLPVELPYEVDFTPKGKPPLATNEKWLNVKCPKCGGKAKRDAETLDTFFDSAWYWYRYVSPHYSDGPFSTDAVDRLTPVDVYFGGAEHTLGHTLYARFFTKFFHDLKLVDYEEFALKRVQHGVVLGPDGYRMSKSRGNVVNPDDQVKEYGADTVRMYLCFMMPYDATAPWSDETIAGVHRFLNRVWKIFHSYNDSSSKILSRLNSLNFRTPTYAKSIKDNRSKSSPPQDQLKQQVSKNFDSSSSKEDKKLLAKLQKTIKKVTSDIERIKMNTAIAAMMEFLNAWEKELNDSTKIFSPIYSKASMGKRDQQLFHPSKLEERSGDSRKNFVLPSVLVLSRENAKKFLQILSPFAPYMTEEIWRNVFGEKKSIHLSKWPNVEGNIVDEEVKIPVQVNGKARAVISMSVDQLSEMTVVKLALKEEKVKKYLVGKKYKAIYVKGKILNLATS